MSCKQFRGVHSFSERLQHTVVDFREGVLCSNKRYACAENSVGAFSIYMELSGLVTSKYTVYPDNYKADRISLNKIKI